MIDPIKAWVIYDWGRLIGGLLLLGAIAAGALWVLLRALT